MPRNSSGIYSLPAGNPVIDGTIIETSWANPTLADIATQLNNVLTRDGLLGPTVAPFKILTGTLPVPGLAFNNALTTGLSWTSGNVVMGWNSAISFTWAADFVTFAAQPRTAVVPLVDADITNKIYVDTAITNHVEIDGYPIGFRTLPPGNETTGVLVLDDVGKCIYATAGGLTLPAGVFAQGDAITVYNTTAADIVVTPSITTFRLAGTTTKGARTIAPYGIGTILFVSATEAVMSGSGVS